MTANKDLKRLVRARAKKTGESYATALLHVRKAAPTEWGAPQPLPTFRRIEKPEYGFALYLPDDWREAPPDPFNSESEVARFSTPGPLARQCLVFLTASEPGVDAAAAARRDAMDLAKVGFDNFRHVPIRLAGRRAERLDFDRTPPEGGVWACRYHYVIAAGQRFCLSFGTGTPQQDAALLDALAARFELIGEPPGAGYVASAVIGNGLDGGGRSRARRRLTFRIDPELRRRVRPYTLGAHQALTAAHEEAVRRDATVVGLEHLLYGTLTGLAKGSPGALADLGAPNEVECAIEAILPIPSVSSTREDGPDGASDRDVPALRLDGLAEHALTLTEEEARARGSRFVGLDDLLVGLLVQDGGPCHELLSRLGVTGNEVLAAARQRGVARVSAWSRRWGGK